MITICFTGRRAKALCGYDRRKYVMFVEDLSSRLEKVCERAKKRHEDPVRFISGGAQGFDQLAFWAVNSLKLHRPDLEVSNVVYVPFRGQETAWEKEGLFSQSQYKKMLEYADDVVYLQDELHERNDIVRALIERNHAMVDNSDYVIALYSENDWLTQKGGTCECMRYAFENEKIIVQIKYVTGPLGIEMTGKWNIIYNPTSK